MLIRSHIARPRVPAAAAMVLAAFVHGSALASVLAESVSVSGDSISRGFDANTSSCNYGDNVTRNFSTGDDHGASFCSAGSTGTLSHAERLECAKGGDVTNFNDAESGATMVGDFAAQATNIKLHLSAALSPRYVPVFMGHNDACTNTTSKTGNGCGGDSDPNNYCRATNAAFEREFRHGLDQLIQIPSVRILVLATVRASELCNFGSKSACGIAGLGGSCQTLWRTLDIVFGSGGVCASLTTDCSDQRRIDMYNTLVGYNAILESVTAEYAAIPSGGLSATGGVKAPDVQMRFERSPFYYQFASNDVSCCDCFHPSDLGQQKLAEASWSGVQCSTTVPCCATSGDPLVDAKCALVDTTSVFPGGFWSGNPCGNGIIDPGEECDDGNSADGDCCSSSCHYDAAGHACGDDGNVCTDDVCNGSGTCLHPNNTHACEDGNLCTQGDVCVAGSCTPGTLLGCSAQDQCHAAGTCNPSTGLCSNPPKPNGSSCSDGSACTQTDTCQAGFCVGGNPVTCTAQDACHTAGTCNPVSGLCSNPTRPDGTPCNDGNSCTQTDACAAGTCTGTNPVVCTASDQCHAAGVCNPTTGVCSNPARADGSACNDGNTCTQTDTCQAGACSGANPVVCTPLDGCHDAGVCDTGTGVCSNPAKPNGSACNDGNACTQTDTCSAGICTGTNPLVCTASDPCHSAGVCNTTTGLCSNPAKPNGTACNDGNACTQTDACASGVCTGTNPVVCTASDQCHAAGTCNPGNGVCSDPPQPDGTACDDGDACTRADRCAAGVCAGPLPSCGDGVVQAGCGEVCDHGAGNGSDQCCAADCRLVDGDGDGVCDRDDPCTNGVAVQKAKLTVARLNTPPGDDRLKLRGDLVLGPVALDPKAHGARLLVTDAAARVVVDAAIPGGAYDYATQTGWKVNKAGTTWKYQNGLTGIAGIVRFQVKIARNGTVQVTGSGKGGSYAVPSDGVPVTMTLVLDPQQACGAAGFPGPAPAARCAFNAAQSTLTCR
jgi:cysteine-rich repeat protein